MTIVNANTRRKIYNVSSDGQTTFAYTWIIYFNTDLTVFRNRVTNGVTVTTTLTLNTDYTVTGVESTTGGNVVLGSSVALTNDEIIISGDMSLTRATNFPSGSVSTDTLNLGFNRLWSAINQIQTFMGRTIFLADEDSTTGVQIPTGTRENLFLTFGSDGQAKFVSALSGNQTVSSFITTLLDDATSLEARTTLDAQEDVVTTQGDLVIGSSSGGVERLAKGTANQIPYYNGTTVVSGNHPKFPFFEIGDHFTKWNASLTLADGWLKLDGNSTDQSSFSTAQWTAVSTLADNGTYDAITRVDTDTIQTVNATGYFLRADGANRDIGNLQDDAFQGHTHNTTNYIAQGSLQGSKFAGAPGNGGQTSDNLSGPISDGTNGTPRTASETRPKNINAGYIYVFIGF